MKWTLSLALLASLWLAGCATQQDASMGHASHSDSRLKPLGTTQLASGKVASLQPPQDLWERIRSGEYRSYYQRMYANR